MASLVARAAARRRTETEGSASRTRRAASRRCCLLRFSERTKKPKMDAYGSRAGPGDHHPRESFRRGRGGALISRRLFSEATKTHEDDRAPQRASHTTPTTPPHANFATVSKSRLQKPKTSTETHSSPTPSPHPPPHQQEPPTQQPLPFLAVFLCTTWAFTPAWQPALTAARMSSQTMSDVSEEQVRGGERAATARGCPLPRVPAAHVLRVTSEKMLCESSRPPSVCTGH
jgi:hypothetical protein